MLKNRKRKRSEQPLVHLVPRHTFKGLSYHRSGRYPGHGRRQVGKYGRRRNQEYRKSIWCEDAIRSCRTRKRGPDLVASDRLEQDLDLDLGTTEAEWDSASLTLPPALSPWQPSLQSTMPQALAKILKSPPMSQVQLHHLPVQSRSTLTTQRPTRDSSRDPGTVNFALNANSGQSQS